MTERKMTPKGFLSKLSSAKSALGFLAAHRDYLVNGEISDITSPIVALVEEGSLMPTPALQHLQAAVFQHVQEVALAKAERSMLPSTNQKEPKAFVASIVNAEGVVQYYTNEAGEEKVLTADFAMPQDAERWCDRKLFDGAPDWRGEIIWTKCPEKLVDFKVRIVEREAAMARTLRKGPGQVMHKSGSSGGLSSKMKCKGDHSHFSHG